MMELYTSQGARKRGNIVAETLVPEMFPRSAKEETQIQKHVCLASREVGSLLFFPSTPVLTSPQKPTFDLICVYLLISVYTQR